MNAKDEASADEKAETGVTVHREPGASKVPGDAALGTGAEAPVPPGAGALLGNVISTDKSPSFFALQFRLNANRETHPGRFVAVETRTADGRDALVLARVDDVHEVNPHEDALSSTLRNVLPFETKYAAEGSSTVIFRVGDAEPLEEAVID